MLKKINFRLIGIIVLSLADDVIIFAILIGVFSWLGIPIPLWAIILLSAILVGFSWVVYRILRKSPQLGFENMIGMSGLAVEPISRKGTVKIHGELWSATTNGEKIEAGDKVMVVGQTGLKLTVARMPVKKAEIEKAGVPQP